MCICVPAALACLISRACGECECGVVQVLDLALHYSATIKSMTQRCDKACLPDSCCEVLLPTGRTCDSARNRNEKPLGACVFNAAHRGRGCNRGKIRIEDSHTVIRSGVLRWQVWIEGWIECSFING